MTTEHRIVKQDEWQAERDELLKEEKELTRRGDELARKRRELPWVPVEKDYRFETPRPRLASPIVAAPPLSRSTISRRIGCASAAKVSLVIALTIE